MRRTQNPHAALPDGISCLKVIMKQQTYGSKAYRKISVPRFKYNSFIFLAYYILRKGEFLDATAPIPYERFILSTLRFWCLK